jgi:phage tail protein X
MRTYRTRQGDTWDIVALRMYPDLGGEKLMSFLMQANPVHATTVVFPANVRLNVPDADIPEVEDLPPWRR